MAVTENWGTNGTAGVLGWTLTPSGNPWAIESYDGTNGLMGWEGGSGCASLGDEYEWVGGVSFRGYGKDGEGAYGPKVLVGSYSGTQLYIGIGWGERGAWYRTTNGGSSYSTHEFAGGPGGEAWMTIDITYSGGTYTGIYTSSLGTGTTTHTGMAGRDTYFYPEIARAGNGGGTSYLIDYVIYDVIYRRTILDFVGTYNDGSSVGTYNFGDDVISIGNVSEYANTPLATRGFSATVPVTIDDTLGAWTDFVGDMTEPSWINGTWLVRQYWGSTWTTLLTGQVNAEDIKYDAGMKTVALSVNSMLRRKAENVLGYDAHYSDGTAAGGQIIDYMTVLMELGTITGTGTDGRTVSFERVDTAYIHPEGGAFSVKFHDSEFLWEGTEATGDSVSIGSAYHKTGDENSAGSLFNEGTHIYSGTFTVSRIPDWMTTGAVMYYTRRWPSSAQIGGAGGYVSYGSNPAGYVKDVLYHMGMGTGAGWAVFGSYLDLWYTVQPQKFYYGGEKYVDIMHHIAQSAMFSYSTDASGEFSGFVMAPTEGTSTASLDFDDAYNNQWAVSYTQPVSKVVVKSSWVESERKFTASHEVEGSDYPSSKTETIEAYWLSSNLNAEGHAVKIQRMYGDPLDQLVLEFEGSEWLNVPSGITVAIANVPESFPIKGTSISAAKVPDYYTVSGKTHLREDDIVQINLTRQIGGNWFRFNVSNFNGTDVLW